MDQHVVDVYEPNLAFVMQEILRKVSNGFSYVALDTEFPGCPVLARGRGLFDFDTVVRNVNLCNMIQLGITLYDNHGRRPADGRSTFVFHFKWIEARETANPESIALLKVAFGLFVVAEICLFGLTCLFSELESI